MRTDSRKLPHLPGFNPLVRGRARVVGGTGISTSYNILAALRDPLLPKLVCSELRVTGTGEDIERVSSLAATDRRNLEKLLRMSRGYVLDFSDRAFGEFVMDNVGLDIHSDKYTTRGTSKANKLRALWRLESDDVVGKLLVAIIDHEQDELLPNGREHADHVALTRRCRQIANRLLAGGSRSA